MKERLNWILEDQRQRKGRGERWRVNDKVFQNRKVGNW